MGPTRNELPPEKKEERAGGGGGLLVGAAGAVNKIAIWEAKESGGSGSLPSSVCEVPIPLSVQERLCILDEESWI